MNDDHDELTAEQMWEQMGLEQCAKEGDIDGLNYHIETHPNIKGIHCINYTEKYGLTDLSDYFLGLDTHLPSINLLMVDHNEELPYTIKAYIRTKKLIPTKKDVMYAAEYNKLESLKIMHDSGHVGYFQQAMNAALRNKNMDIINYIIPKMLANNTPCFWDSTLSQTREKLSTCPESDKDFYIRAVMILEDVVKAENALTTNRDTDEDKKLTESILNHWKM